jgi:photosystem II stability/assembly factor-like uncharacterized protein
VEIAALISPLASGIASTEDGRIWTCPASPTVTVADFGRIKQVIGEYRAAPDDPLTLYGAAQYVVYRSSDGGESWTFLYSSTPYVNTIGSIIIQNARIVFIGTNLGVYKTIDSGDNWIHLNSGLPENFTVGALAQDPSQTATMYAGGKGGVYKTVDGGSNWSKVGVGLGATTITDLTVDAQGKVYAVSQIGAYVLSTDGETWEQLNADLGTFEVNGLLVDP